MNDILLDTNFDEISIENLNLDIISYNYCVNNGIKTLDDILNIPISYLKNHNLVNLFNKVHSLNLKFYYEDQNLKLLKFRYNSGERITLSELKFIFDTITNQFSIQYFGMKFYDITQLKKRLKLLISANFFTQHDLILIQQLFNVDVKKIIYELELAKLDQNLSLNLSNLNLNSRAINPLLRANIDTLGMLILIPSSDLINFRNLGSGSLKKIIDCVHDMGYKFVDELNESYDLEFTFKDDDIISKIDIQKQENDDLSLRIKKKEDLLNKYRELILEKEKLLMKEKELDLKIENAIDIINKLYGEKYEKVRK